MYARKLYKLAGIELIQILKPKSEFFLYKLFLLREDR